MLVPVSEHDVCYCNATACGLEDVMLQMSCVESSWFIIPWIIYISWDHWV